MKCIKCRSDKTHAFYTLQICDNCRYAWIPSETVQPRQAVSTKARSLAACDITGQSLRVLDFVKVNPNSSRSEIATKGGFRLQSVCSYVKRLLDLGEMEVSGEKLDPSTNRMVEALIVVTKES